MFDYAAWPFAVHIGVFVAAALVITFSGICMTRIADRLADLTGLGESFFGAVFLGATTSLPGIMTSVTAAVQGHPDLAISNAIGGIAAQTVFLAVADVTYLRANLEHAAASVGNMMQGVLLIILLSLPLLFMTGPNWSLAGIHPGSLVLLIAYIYGLRLTTRAEHEKTWLARRTSETREDKPQEHDEDGPGLAGSWLRFGIFGFLLAASGYFITQSGIAIANRTGLSETAVGGMFTAITTSLPELIVAVTAVRQGALTLAVSNIIGGNCFDVLFLAFADAGFREGSLYHQFTSSHLFIISLTMLMTSILILGLLRREKHGVANIGFESMLILILYLTGSVWVFMQ